MSTATGGWRSTHRDNYPPRLSNVLHEVIKLITLITQLLFAAALFLPSLAHGADPSANFSVQVVPPGSGPTVPPQAAAQGYTALALNADFSKGIDIDCEGEGNETQAHQWYTGMQGVVNTFQGAAGCGAGLNPAANPNGPIMWPFVDPATKDTVLNIRRTTTPSTSTYQGNMGSILGRVAVTSLSYNQDHGTKYPINVYVECVERMWPIDVMGMWSNCWGGGDLSPGAEIDINEIHSSSSYGYGNPTALWWKWDECGGCAFGGGDILKVLPSWRPDEYHKYGILLYQTSATNMHFCGYIDDIQIQCNDVTPSARELAQGSSWLLSMTTGNPCCGEGAWAITDQPIVGVGFDSGRGTTYVDVGGIFAQNSCCLQNDYGVRISGTNTSADGYWSWQQSGTRLYLYGPRSIGPQQSPCCGGGNAVPLSGTWSGGGTFNLPGAGTGGGRGHDHAFNHSVKSFRIWTCANWRTTQCSPYNNNPYN
jgi:hypothetical protein